jgi:hypothetical protein
MKIPPAFMEDANKAFCDDIHYEIRKTDTDTFLDLVLDTDWISEPERVYPIVIDPRVEMSGSNNTNLKMVELSSDGSKVAHSATALTRRIGIDGSGNIHRLYLDLNLPQLASSYKISQAGLILSKKNYTSSSGFSDNYIIARLVTLAVNHCPSIRLLGTMFNH